MQTAGLRHVASGPNRHGQSPPTGAQLGRQRTRHKSCSALTCHTEHYTYQIASMSSVGLSYSSTEPQQDPDDVDGFVAAAAARQSEHLRDSDCIVARQSWIRHVTWASSLTVSCRYVYTGGSCMSQRLLPATAAPTIRQIHAVRMLLVQAFISCRLNYCNSLFYGINVKKTAV